MNRQSMLNSSEKPERIRCPYCYSERIKRDGNTIKGAQRFFCHLCRKYWQANYIRTPLIVIDDQKKLFDWIKIHPILSAYLINIPKSWDKQAATASCDIFLAYPNTLYHGLWIHLKKEKNVKSPLSENMNPRLNAMLTVGYKVAIAYGWQEAIEKIENYLLTVK